MTYGPTAWPTDERQLALTSAAHAQQPAYSGMQRRRRAPAATRPRAAARHRPAHARQERLARSAASLRERRVIQLLDLAASGQASCRLTVRSSRAQPRPCQPPVAHHGPVDTCSASAVSSTLSPPKNRSLDDLALPPSISASAFKRVVERHEILTAARCDTTSASSQRHARGAAAPLLQLRASRRLDQDAPHQRAPPWRGSAPGSATRTRLTSTSRR